MRGLIGWHVLCGMAGGLVGWLVIQLSERRMTTYPCVHADSRRVVRCAAVAAAAAAVALQVPGRWKEGTLATVYLARVVCMHVCRCCACSLVWLAGCSASGCALG